MRGCLSGGWEVKSNEKMQGTYKLADLSVQGFTIVPSAVEAQHFAIILQKLLELIRVWMGFRGGVTVLRGKTPMQVTGVKTGQVGGDLLGTATSLNVRVLGSLLEGTLALEGSLQDISHVVLQS